MLNAIYIAHTQERSKLDVRFSILCLLHHSDTVNYSMRIVVISDHPEWFEDLPVIVEHIDRETIVRWKGEYDFLHRLKIKAIMHIRDKYDGDLLYMDGDTCFFKDVILTIAWINEGMSLMHELEGCLIDRSNLTLKRTHDFFRKHPSIETSAGMLAIKPEQGLFNAGVIGISRVDAHLLETVLAYNDAAYPLFRNHVTEQLMFSHVLSEHTDISACNDSIFHWWGRAKQAGVMLTEFFEQNKGKDLPTMSANAHHFVETLKTAEKDRMSFLQNLGRSLEKRRKRLYLFLKR